MTVNAIQQIEVNFVGSDPDDNFRFLLRSAPDIANFGDECSFAQKLRFKCLSVFMGGLEVCSVRRRRRFNYFIPSPSPIHLV